MRKDGSINEGNDGCAGYRVWERPKPRKFLDRRRDEACGMWDEEDLIMISEYEGMISCTMDNLEKRFMNLNIGASRHPISAQNCISAHLPRLVTMWFLFHYHNCWFQLVGGIYLTLRTLILCLMAPRWHIHSRICSHCSTEEWALSKEERTMEQGMGVREEPLG